MAKKVKPFTFKNDPKLKGLSAIGESIPTARIRLNGEVVGWIVPPSYRTNECKAYFHVKKEPTVDEPASFKNVQMKNTTKSVEEMKEWLKENTEKIISSLDLAPRNDK